MTTLAALQPAYLPWLGFFDQMWRADVFVIYDDVDFDKNGWRNRNRVKSTSGEPFWLTVPVRQAGRSGQSLLEVEIDSRAPWARKHAGSLRQFYGGARYKDRYLPPIAELLLGEWTHLVDLDLALIRLLSEWLGIDTDVVRMSDLSVEGSQTGRLVSLCRRFGADCYLTGDAAREYLDVESFASEGIEVLWQDYAHPTYPQQHGTFVPYLSVLDLLLNCGDKSLDILTAGRPETTGSTP